MVSGGLPAGACLVRQPWIRPSSSPRAPQGLGAQGEPGHSYLRNLRMHLDYSLFAMNSFLENEVFRQCRKQHEHDMGTRVEHNGEFIYSRPPCSQVHPLPPTGSGQKPRAGRLSVSLFLLSAVLRNLNHHHLQPLRRIFRCD